MICDFLYKSIFIAHAKLQSRKERNRNLGNCGADQVTYFSHRLSVLCRWFCLFLKGNAFVSNIFAILIYETLEWIEPTHKEPTIKRIRNFEFFRILCHFFYKVLFFKSYSKVFQKSTHKTQKNAWNLYLNRYYGPYNLMFEDYFIQMLITTALQMVQPLSSILTYSFQHFGRHFTNKCTHWKTTLKHLFVRYRPKCWQEYAKTGPSGCSIWSAVTVVNICME